MTNPSDRSKRMKALFGGLDPAALEKIASARDESVLQAQTPAPASVQAPAQTTEPAAVTSSAANPASPPLASSLSNQSLPKRVTSGAIRSMSDTFSGIEAENAQLREQLAEAEKIIALDPALIHPSFVQDRMEPQQDPAFDALVDSLARDGQQVPILVRPHPDHEGHYQIAYGHRRWRAASKLDLSLQAIIRPLSDEALVIAQGKENSERKDLSFIEQAVFALRLKDRGFDRATIAAALGRSENRGLAYISMITGIAAAMPADLIERIGAAPRSGRPKWEQIIGYFTDSKLSSQQNSAVNGLTSSGKWQGAESDKRLAMLINLLSKADDQSTVTAEKPAPPQILYGENNKQYISILPHPDGLTLRIDERQASGLSDWLIQQLPDLIAAFDKEKSR